MFMGITSDELIAAAKRYAEGVECRRGYTFWTGLKIGYCNGRLDQQKLQQPDAGSEGTWIAAAHLDTIESKLAGQENAAATFATPQLSEKIFRQWMMGLFMDPHPIELIKIVKAKELAEQIISFAREHGLLNSNLR